MSTQAPVLSLTERTVSGKKVKSVRHDGMIPAVISERGKPSVNVQGVYLSMERTFHAVGKHRPVELEIGKDKKLAMIKDVSMDPVRHRISHISFHAVNRNEVVSAEVGVKIIGEVPATRLGLTVLDTLRTVEIEALPSKLPDTLEVDGSKLTEVGDRLHVSEIIPVDGVTVMTDPEAVLAIVEMPRDAEAEAAKEAEEAAAAAPASEVPAENGGEPAPAAE